MAFGAPNLTSNGASIVLPSILPSLRDTALPKDSASGLDLIGGRLGVKDGQLDFFSVHPYAGPGNPVLRGGLGGDGLQIQLNW